MSLTFRDASATDLPVLNSIFQRASLSNENDRQTLLDHPEWLALPDAGIREGRTRIALDDGSVIVGFATYLINDGIAELEDLFVDPPCMRRGIGKQLVLDLSTLLRALGFETLEVTANPHAMDFYEYMGFVTDQIVDTVFYPAPRMKRQIG